MSLSVAIDAYEARLTNLFWATDLTIIDFCGIKDTAVFSDIAPGWSTPTPIWSVSLTARSWSSIPMTWLIESTVLRAVEK
jgi:hypothetical protein